MSGCVILQGLIINDICMKLLSAEWISFLRYYDFDLQFLGLESDFV